MLHRIASRRRETNDVEAPVTTISESDHARGKPLNGVDRGVIVLGVVAIGLLVYNAASVSVGRFLERDLAQHMQSIEVNCRGPVTLSYHFGGLMAARGRGGIVVMTSGAAFAGSGFLASYSASKAFDLNLGYTAHGHGPLLAGMLVGEGVVRPDRNRDVVDAE